MGPNQLKNEQSISCIFNMRDLRKSTYTIEPELAELNA